MASVATPEYPVTIVNSAAILSEMPKERTPAQVMEQIEAWPFWIDVKRVAHKEYGMKPECFDHLLPEYQRFLGLILLGYTPLGMFSRPVDEIWHSHVLCSHLYLHFCLGIHGQVINHVAQVPVPEDEIESAICTTCRSCRDCSGGGQGGGQGQGSVQEFISSYREVFKCQPSTVVWNLSEVEGCAVG